MKNDLSKYLLASDIDGTIINKYFQIPQRNKDKINEFRENGGLFTLATGRSVESARPFAETLKLDTPAIVLNGAVIYDYKSEKILYTDPLDKSEAIRFLKAAYENFINLGIEIHIGNRLHVIRENIKVFEHIKNEHMPVSYSDVDSLVNMEWHKVLFSADTDELIKFEEWAKNNPPEKSYFVKTATIYFELLNKTAHKGNALKRLAEIQNIKRENVCAIGDYYNDKELIEAAGISSYTENAPDELKKSADFVSCHCENGAVAEFIEYIENNNKRGN